MALMRTSPYGRTSPRTKTLDSSIDARRTCTKINHPVRHRSNDSLVTVLTCGSSTAEIIQHTTCIPCGLCCKLPKQERIRTSQKCYRGPSIQSTCPNSDENSPRSSLRRNRPQEACHHIENECHIPDLTHNPMDNLGYGHDHQRCNIHTQKPQCWLGVGGGVGVVMSASMDQPISRPVPSEKTRELTVCLNTHRTSRSTVCPTTPQS